MENFENFEQLLLQRSYAELTEDEKQWVNLFVDSEAEYESLRQTNHQMRNYFSNKAVLIPSPKVWTAIKSDLALAKKPSSRSYWLSTPLPAYATLSLLVAVGVLCWYGGSNFNSPKVPESQIVTRIDTVFIASKPDTIVRERIVYLKATPAPAIIQASTSQSQDVPATKGINMKEKEELERLLVSGSR
jgi:hypothetical protein